MKRIFLTFGTVAAMTLIGAGAAQADRLPGGSWRDSCANASVRGGVLGALCRTRDGRMRYSRIDLDRCRGEITNQDGQLSCREERYYHERLPGGSWRQSCTNASVRDGVLGALCRTRDGRMRYSRIDIRGCRDDISNQNGRLTCGGHRVRLPGGSWQQSCTNASIRGWELGALCRTRDGRMRYSRIDLGRCHGNISNRDGYLTCGR